MNRPRPRFIDVTTPEVELPTDPLVFPDRVIDQGVIPWAMVEHLRVADEFPVTPALKFVGSRFIPIEGGRCLWAARAAAWAPPIRSLLFAEEGSVPGAVWQRTLPFTKDTGADNVPIDLRAQTLCFARNLSEPERAAVLAELDQLAATANAKGLPMFAAVESAAWRSANVLQYRTPVSANPEDRGMARDWTETVARIQGRGIPLVAWNGRAR